MVWLSDPQRVDILGLRIVTNVSNSVAHDAVSDEVIKEGHERVTVLYALTEDKKIASCGRDRRYGGVPYRCATRSRVKVQRDR
jgi:hypothetical protein